MRRLKLFFLVYVSNQSFYSCYDLIRLMKNLWSILWRGKDMSLYFLPSFLVIIFMFICICLVYWIAIFLWNEMRMTNRWPLLEVQAAYGKKWPNFFFPEWVLGLTRQVDFKCTFLGCFFFCDLNQTDFVPFSRLKLGKHTLVKKKK